MEEGIVIPAVSEDFEYPTNVEYLSDAVGNTTTNTVNLMNDQPITVIQNLELMDLVQMFIVYAFIIAAALSAIFIFIGGVSFILSGGEDEKIKRAINTIRYAIIGLIITILSFTVVTIIGRMFGLNFLDYLSYGQIRDSIERLVKNTNSKTSGNFDIQR